MLDTEELERRRSMSVSQHPSSIESSSHRRTEIDCSTLCK